MVKANAAHMARALALARQGLSTSQPNPSVGCVIVQRGEVVGEGFHARAGEPHAEPLALKQAGAKARGADLYVTLEPCSHHGRTPPCVDALIAAGVRRVYAALEDPNPLVAGRGLAQLREAGVEVEVGLLAQDAARVHRGFLSRMTRGRPHLTLKLAMSLDGRTAMAGGESKWITGEAARADAHRLRAEAGAVLTSSATVEADDPELTVRLGAPVPRQPDRIVLDTSLRTVAAANVWKPGARRIALAVRPPADRVAALRAAGVEVELVGTQGGRVDLASALATLGRMEINEVLAECGPTLAGALLAGGHVDELVLYVAPCLLGHDARALAQLPGLKSLNDRIRLAFASVEKLGPDLKIVAVPERA